MDVFASRIYEMRKELALTQLEVAQTLGINESAYQKYEYSQTKPQITGLVKLGELFQISLNYLCGRTDKKIVVKKKFPNDIMTLLATSLKEARHKKECLQREVAGILKINISTYQKYELGLIMPSYSNFMKLVEFYGLDIERILGR